MPRDVNYMSAMAYQRAENDSISVPKRLARMIKSDFVIAYCIENKEQVNILGLNKNDFDVERNKIFNILIKLSTEDMKSVIQIMMNTFGKERSGAYKVLWQTGVCDIETESYSGCIWQGLIVTPLAETKDSLEDNIMQANLAIDMKTFRGVDAEEVVVELVDRQ